MREHRNVTKVSAGPHLSFGSVRIANSSIEHLDDWHGRLAEIIDSLWMAGDAAFIGWRRVQFEHALRRHVDADYRQWLSWQVSSFEAIQGPLLI